MDPITFEEEEKLCYNNNSKVTWPLTLMQYCFILMFKKKKAMHACMVCKVYKWPGTGL